jgi:hypothetical protein
MPRDQLARERVTEEHSLAAKERRERKRVKQTSACPRFFFWDLCVLSRLKDQ